MNLVDVDFVDLGEVEFCHHHDSWLLFRKCYVFEFTSVICWFKLYLTSNLID